MGNKQELTSLKKTIKEFEEETRKLRQTEEALRENERFLESIFDAIQDGISILDRDLNIIRVNAWIENMYADMSPLAGKKCYQVYQRKDKPCPWCPSLQTLDTGAPHSAIVPYPSAENPIRWNEVSSFPFRNAQNQILGVIEYKKDITQQKAVEAALRANEEKYRDIFENVSDFLYYHDLDGNFLETNVAFKEGAGYGKESLPGLNVGDLIPDRYKNQAKDYLRRVREKGIDEGLMRVRRKDGKEIIVEYRNSLVFDQKKPIGIRGSARDITERVGAQKALKESEKKYRTILETIEEGYYEVDLSGNFIFFNEALCKILGHDPHEIKGNNFRSYTNKTTAYHVYQTFNSVYTSGIPSKGFDWMIIRKDGTAGYVEISVSLIKDSTGKPTGFRGIARDVTERQITLKEKEGLETQLYQAQKMEAIGTLAGGIAHDFNNLLMGIQGRTSLMLMDAGISNAYFDHLKGIEEYIQSAADLTKQLLGFARGGKYQVKPTDLNELVKRSSDMFARTKKEISIHGKYQDKILTADVDPGQVEQVLLNLYVNAWQAMPAGGNLSLQTQNVTLNKKQSKALQLEPGKYIKISVSDNGVGMDGSTQQRIFEPFFTTKGMGRGTGLGLASAYGIIKNHGGAMQVQSERGKGSTFDIFLPVSEKEIAEEKETEKEVVRGSETILLVDDEDMMLDVGGQILKKMGYKLFKAGTGQEAIKVYKKNKRKIDLVILDMIMPEMSGGETYERLKEINQNIQVLLASGYSMDGQAKKILDRGCNGFIQKPFKVKELSRKIRDILDRR